jgi:hypothetical protein
MGKSFVHGKALTRGLVGDKMLPRDDGEPMESSSSLRVGESMCLMCLTVQILPGLFTSLPWGRDPWKLLGAAALLENPGFCCPWLN